MVTLCFDPLSWRGGLGMLANGGTGFSSVNDLSVVGAGVMRPSQVTIKALWWASSGMAQRALQRPGSLAAGAGGRRTDTEGDGT